MDKANIFDFIKTTSSGMTVEHVTLNMLITLVIAMFIYWIYKKTYDGVLYSKSFNTTLVMVAMVTAMVMMVIGSNLALSLGMVGALSIIRFRSAIKNPKDIGFLFWAIACGLAAGTGSYLIAITGSLIIAILMFAINKHWTAEQPYLLIVKGNNVDERMIDTILNNGNHKCNLKMKSKNQDELEVIYEARFRDGDQNSILGQLRDLDEVKSVNLVSYKGEVTG